MRWGRFNEYACNGQCPGIDQNTYPIGRRIPIKNFRKFTPYGKVLVGFGNGSWLTGPPLWSVMAAAWTTGSIAGSPLRADFEFQQWPVTSPSPIPGQAASSFTVRPYGVSAGLSYRIF